VGANAALKILGLDPLIFKPSGCVHWGADRRLGNQGRRRAFIDMFTSRAERRLILRQDIWRGIRLLNAADRLGSVRPVAASKPSIMKS
jgi:tRNA U34 5-carboxymethylaminomethyl modifying enzyme MnmG/GidA